MADHSARVIAVWNESPSGAKSTVMHAERKGMPVTTYKVKLKLL